jgi:HemY protein
LVACLAELGPEWLPRIEAALSAAPRDPAVAYAAGCALSERQLWGKASPQLERAAQSPDLSPSARRHAWRLLAQLAIAQGDHQRAAGCYETAAGVG